MREIGQRVELRVAGVLVENAKREARRRGMTLSEFMRDALRRALPGGKNALYEFPANGVPTTAQAFEASGR